MNARMRRRTPAQALVEFAFTFPLWALVVFSLIQLGLIFIEYYSEAQMALSGARWLAIHSQATDTEFMDYMQGRMLPGLVGGPPQLIQQGNADPLNPLPTIYKVGGLTITYTPCVYTSGYCTHPNRVPSATLYVTTAYDLANVLFLPSHYRIGFYSLDLPNTLPAYTVFKMVE